MCSNRLLICWKMSELKSVKINKFLNRINAIFGSWHILQKITWTFSLN